MARDHEYNDFMPPCMGRPKRREPVGCECTEDPAVKDYRRLFCHFLDAAVVIIADNFFTIVSGVVDRVSQGTVELTDAEVFGVPVPKLSIALTKINAVIPIPPGGNGNALAAGIRAKSQAPLP